MEQTSDSGEGCTILEWDPSRCLANSETYYEFSKHRYEVEANRLNSMRTVVALAITNTVIISGGLVTLLDKYHYAGIYWAMIQLTLFVVAVLLLISVAKSILQFFTGFKHGYPVTPSKAKIEIYKIEEYIEQYHHLFKSTVSKDALLKANGYQYLGDAYASYAEFNAESNDLRAELLESIWQRIFFIIPIAALIFSIQKFVRH